MSSTNDGRLNVVRNTLLACRTNDPDEAAVYIELIDKIDELIHYRGGTKRIDQWVDELEDREEEAEGYPTERPDNTIGADDLFRKFFPKGFPYGA